MSDAQASEDDDGGIFCQSCSPTTRKCGYYLTFILGFIAFVFGFFNAFTGSVWLIIVGSLVVLFCPLWIKSPCKCLQDFKDVLKMTSALIFIVFLVLNILNSILWDKGEGGFLTYLLGICLALSGGWYFLTFFPNGQKACIACVKSCCGGSEKV